MNLRQWFWKTWLQLIRAAINKIIIARMIGNIRTMRKEEVSLILNQMLERIDKYNLGHLGIRIYLLSQILKDINGHASGRGTSV